MNQPDYLQMKCCSCLANPNARALVRRRAVAHLLYDQRLTLASMTSLIELRDRLKAEDQSYFETDREVSASPLLSFSQLGS